MQCAHGFVVVFNQSEFRLLLTTLRPFDHGSFDLFQWLAYHLSFRGLMPYVSGSDSVSPLPQPLFPFLLTNSFALQCLLFFAAYHPLLFSRQLELRLCFFLGYNFFFEASSSHILYCCREGRMYFEDDYRFE